MDKNKVAWETPPENLEKIRVEEPKESAGGFTAVRYALKHSLAEMGVLRTAQTLRQLNQKEGFDCPGCAWPDPEKRSVAEFCENGAKAVAEEATNKTIGPEFFATKSIVELSRYSDYELGKSGRLTHPLYLPSGKEHYQEITWTKAFEIIAKELNDLDSPNEAAFYTSGRTSNEAAFLFQLFARLYGTNNLPDCSNMCHESSGTGLKEVIGIGKGTVKLEDFNEADCIVVFGQNPGTNHPRMLTALQGAARNGCKIITVNPILEAGSKGFAHPQEVSGMLGKTTSLTDLFLPVKINGDVPLIKGLMKHILDLESKDPGKIIAKEFIEEKTLGFHEFTEDLKNTSWELIVQESGITQEKIQEAATIIANSKKMICCWAMGLTQHENGVANIQEVANLLLLGGHLGRPGAGACPVRGHSNVQGDRTVGIVSKPGATLIDKLKENFGFTPPHDPGVDTVAAIEAMAEEKVKIFFALGGNFLSATPDTKYTAQALQKCRLTVQVSTKLNRGHLITGKQALILPCLGRTEIDKTGKKTQFVTVENSMGFVHKTAGRLKPASTMLISEIEIVVQLAQATFAQTEKFDKVPWEELKNDYSKIRDLIEKTIPGFNNYNDKINKNKGFYLPNAVRDEQKFVTSSGKAHFTVHPIVEKKLPSNHFLMMTIRTHDQYNTTIYGLDDRYRGITGGRRVVLIHPEDLTQNNWQAGDKIDIVSHFQGEKRTAKEFLLVPYEIPRQCIATYFPETNVLVPLSQKAKKSNTPASKSVEVSLHPHS